MHDTQRFVGTIVKGAIAGLVATWVMGRTTTWIHRLQSERTRSQENEARGGRTAFERAAGKASDLAGLELSGSRRRRAGAGLHWATGVAAGALYAALRQRWPATAAGIGLPYGSGFFVLVDEIMNPLLRLTPGPGAFPWQTHARGLGGHLAFGMATELVLEGLDRWLPDGPARSLRVG